MNHPEKKTVLIADDDAAIRTVLSQALKREGYNVEAADNGATLYQWVMEGRGDLVITDVMMPGENGIDLIPKIHRRAPRIKVIVMSAQNALTTAVAASERGAVDFLPKPFDIDALLLMVASALRSGAAQDNHPVTDTAEVLDKSFVVGQSRSMQEVYRTIARLRLSDLGVLITGESGTGKEVVARALHTFSSRKSGAFVAVNMAALPRELIESELFGHEKGAFTGATQKTAGRFEQAAGGTIFLDEIGDMPYDAQTRLLRVLQEGEFTAVGGRRTQKTNVRIIAATNNDLQALVRAGRFREDLYYRLNVVPLHIPPLRERSEDIPALVRHFAPAKVFSVAAMQMLQTARWPGNIRELENIVRRICALCPDDVISETTVGEELHRAVPVQSGFDATDMVETVARLLQNDTGGEGVYDRIIAKIEKPLIESILQSTGGNQIRAADILGLNRNTLRKKIRELDIDIKKG
jgi:two-component system nitrogen regulation response regulator GlnG